jgi:ArsR family transcriptional regulator
MKQPLPDQNQDQDQDRMFALAAEMFRVMSAPTRLKIISHLCEGEKNVSELIALIKTTQPNISQHLNTLHQAGIVGRRRAGVQIYYHIANDRIVALCRSLCGIVSAEAQIPHP